MTHFVFPFLAGVALFVARWGLVYQATRHAFGPKQAESAILLFIVFDILVDSKVDTKSEARDQKERQAHTLVWAVALAVANLLLWVCLS